MGNTSFPRVAKSVAVVCTNDRSGAFVKAAEQVAGSALVSADHVGFGDEIGPE